MNNAGILEGSVGEILTTNVFGVKLMCDAFVPLIDSGHGRIVNLSSELGPGYVGKLSKDH